VASKAALAAEAAFRAYWRDVKARWDAAVMLAGGPRPEAGGAGA
jgi:hypothetical protein